MKIGDYVETPRFLKVKIKDILTREEARKQGYVEPTHYNNDPEYDILGKCYETNHMWFVAVRKEYR